MRKVMSTSKVSSLDASSSIVNNRSHGLSRSSSCKSCTSPIDSNVAQSIVLVSLNFSWDSRAYRSWWTGMLNCYGVCSNVENSLLGLLVLCNILFVFTISWSTKIKLESTIKYEKLRNNKLHSLVHSHISLLGLVYLTFSQEKCPNKDLYR